MTIKNNMHTCHPYLLNPMHALTVTLIGAGGTGSRMLTNLAALDQALKGLGHPGLEVCCFDDDVVTKSNIGRQSFSPADIGLPKAAVLINRINRYYGLNWTYQIRKITDYLDGNIIITCVDNKASRRFVESYRQRANESRHQRKTLYWLDCGNGKDFGQVILSTRYQPSQLVVDEDEIDEEKAARYTSPIDTLRSPSEIIPDAFTGKEDNKPSCSVAESLRKQSLFINQTIALYASNLLYQLITEGMIDYHGVFINLKTLQTNKLKISNDTKRHSSVHRATESAVL